MALLEAVGLYRFYHSGDFEVVALRDVGLSLHKGELVALLGPSGSGKSTLLHVIAGLDDPDGGYVDIAGFRLSRQPEKVRAARRARHIGMFLQSGNLIDHLTVAGNIELQRRLAGKPKGRPEALAGRLGLSAHWDALPFQLSGGEAARAGLAVALSAEPEVLLCDEPTAEVDADTEQRILAELFEQRKGGAAILVATHSPVLAAAADRVVKLRHGRVADD